MLNISPADKVAIRHFLASETAQRWFANCEQSYPRVDITKVPSKDLYDIGMYEAQGWRKCLECLKSSVEDSQPLPDYGLSCIDVVTD
jgi:hypothetical protein